MCELIIWRWWSCCAGRSQESELNQLLTSDRPLSQCEVRQVEEYESASRLQRALSPDADTGFPLFQRAYVWIEERQWSPF